jgi:undecaprenyl-phosphate 4-deoxy-4-formamido-L-arabinose transferase
MATGKYVVIMDDDLQHAPKDIFKLYNKCKEGYDVCYAEFPRKYQAFWKNFGSWMNGKLAEKLLSKPPEVYMSPFKILRGDLVSELVKFLGAYPYVDATILTITSNFSQVPVEHHERFRGKSNYHLIPSMSVFIKHATSYSVYPLRLASYMGFGCATAAFLLGCFYLIDYFFFGDHVEGWTTIILLNIFFGGVILMSLGIIGEYIGRMYLCVNGKPQYSIEKVVRNQQAEPEVMDTATGGKVSYAAGIINRSQDFSDDRSV